MEAPKFRRGSGPNQLPMGQADMMNELMAEDSEPDLGPDPGQIGMFEPGMEDLEGSLLRQTDRPDEPVTSGQPFGPGPNTMPTPRDRPGDFRRRVAKSLVDAPGATDSVREFAARLASGD
jgi:hypothetical protein